MTNSELAARLRSIDNTPCSMGVHLLYHRFEAPYIGSTDDDTDCRRVRPGTSGVITARCLHDTLAALPQGDEARVRGMSVVEARRVKNHIRLTLDPNVPTSSKSLPE
jgi:hypothetical protein